MTSDGNIFKDYRFST